MTPDKVETDAVLLAKNARARGAEPACVLLSIITATILVRLGRTNLPTLCNPYSKSKQITAQQTPNHIPLVQIEVVYPEKQRQVHFQLL